MCSWLDVHHACQGWVRLKIVSIGAWQVMKVVKDLTKTGITICATIHNPTPYCFNLFDRLMILLHGRVVYSGENGVPPRPS
jgi:ABC-type lipopolysaccharide export system ATPase subunit